MSLTFFAALVPGGEKPRSTSRRRASETSIMMQAAKRVKKLRIVLVSIRCIDYLLPAQKEIWNLEIEYISVRSGQSSTRQNSIFSENFQFFRPKTINTSLTLQRLSRNFAWRLPIWYVTCLCSQKMNINNIHTWRICFCKEIKVSQCCTNTIPNDFLKELILQRLFFIATVQQIVRNFILFFSRRVYLWNRHYAARLKLYQTVVQISLVIVTYLHTFIVLFYINKNCTCWLNPAAFCDIGNFETISPCQNFKYGKLEAPSVSNCA